MCKPGEQLEQVNASSVFHNSLSSRVDDWLAVLNIPMLVGFGKKKKNNLSNRYF